MGVGVGALVLGGARLARRGVPAPPPVLQASDRALDVAGDEPLRVVLLGTSLTSRGQWPEALQERLVDDCATDDVVVERVALAGAASDWGSEQVGQVLAARPDVVVVEFGVNDADLLDGLALSASRATHEQVLDALLEDGGPAVALMTTNPVEGRRGLVRAGLRSYEAMYRELAERRSVGLVDNAPRWRRLTSERFDQLVPDGLHPSDEGHREVTVPGIAGVVCGSLPADDA